MKNWKGTEETVKIDDFQIVDNSTNEDPTTAFILKSVAVVALVDKVLKSKNMTQRDLAKKMGKSEAEISKLISGLHNLTLTSICKIEIALGMQILEVPEFKAESTSLGRTKPDDRQVIWQIATQTNRFEVKISNGAHLSIEKNTSNKNSSNTEAGYKAV